MNVVWTPQARQDRFEIWARIAAEDPYAAARMDELFAATVKRLVDHPELGREGLIPGTREFIVHQSYRLVYEIDHDHNHDHNRNYDHKGNRDQGWILALVHTHRQGPPVDP